MADGRFVLEKEKELLLAWPRECEVCCRLERRPVDTRGVTAYGWGV